MRNTWLALVLALVSCDSSSGRFDALSDAIEHDIAASNATGASVAIWLDDEIIYVGGFGTADPAGGEAPDENTRFQIGSDTKKLTALSLLRKVAAGRVTLETTVGDVLPDLSINEAPAFSRTTLRQLLSHQSGIVDRVELTSSTTDAGLSTFAYGELATTYYSMVDPGTFYNYANPNFSIAGLIDERLDDRPWADIVEADLFAPLGMTRTVARKSELDDNTAIGNGLTVTSEDGAIERIDIANTWESAFVRPAGLVWSTPSDQARLARFLVDGDSAVLDPSLLHELTSSQVPMYPELSPGYGFGLMLDRGVSLDGQFYEMPVWAHGGVTLSYSSAFYVLPEQRFAISILSNGRTDDFASSIVAAMTTLVDLPSPTSQPSPDFDASRLDALAGTYDAFDGDIGPFELVITRSGDKLSISVPVLDEEAIPYEHDLTPLSTHMWIATLGGESEEIAFFEQNDATYLRNRQFVGRRR